MKTNRPVPYIATPARVFMTTLLILLVVVIVQVSLMEVAPMLWARYPAPPAPTTEKELSAEQKRMQRIVHAKKEFLPDGTLQLVTRIGGSRYVPQYGPDSPTTQVQVYDVNDKLLWEGPTKESPYDYLTWAQDVRPDSLPAFRLHMARIAMPDFSRTLEFPVATGEELLEVWRYNPWHDCFIGYSLQGKKLGYLGAAGRTEAKSQAQPFGPFGSFLAWWPPEAYSPTLLWQTDRRIYEISFDRQQVEPIFESPDSDITDIYICQWDSYRPGRGSVTAADRQLLYCQTRDSAHHVILRAPDQTVTVTTPDDWQKWFGSYYRFAATEQNLFLRRDWIEYPAPSTRKDSNWWSEYRKAAKTQWVELYHVSETGALDLVNRYSWTVPREDRGAAPAGYRDPRSYVKPYVTAFSPLACDLIWTGLPGTRRDSLRSDSEWMREFVQSIDAIRPGYAIGSWLVMATMLALTFLHARARCTSKAAFAFWLVFVALLNLPGFLVYWALNHTPVIKCSACGKRRGLRQTDCVRCGVPLPTPEHGKLDLIFGL